MARYEAGETLSSIARTYDCSPPAISYIVNRSRARHPSSAPSDNEAPRLVSAGETQLIKAPSNGGDDREAPAHPPLAEPPQPDLMRRLPEPPASLQSQPRDDQPRDEVRPTHANEERDSLERPQWPAREPPHEAPSAAAAMGDQRAKLHLHLGRGSHESGSPSFLARQRPPAAPSHAPNSSDDPPHTGVAEGQQPRTAAPNYTPTVPHHPAPMPHGNGHSGNGGPRKDSSGSFIDRDLRARVEADITVFLAAFDAAMSRDSSESRAALREATDRLLRAGARTRIELERLEARIPLPPREPAHPDPAWRQR